MRIEIRNPNGIVTGAFAQDHGELLSVFINMKERWVRHSFTTSCDGEWGIGYDPDEMGIDDKPDEVMLFADTKRERELLKNLHFELLNKDQLWMIFVPKELYADGKYIHVHPKKKQDRHQGKI